MSNLEKALKALREKPQSDNRDTILEPFNSLCLSCIDEEQIANHEAKLKKALEYYGGFNDIAEILANGQ